MTAEGRLRAADRAQDLDAVGVGQFEVEQHDVGERSRERGKRSRAGLGVDQLDIELLQHLVIEAQDRRRILDQQQARFCRHAPLLQHAPCTDSPLVSND